MYVLIHTPRSLNVPILFIYISFIVPYKRKFYFLYVNFYVSDF